MEIECLKEFNLDFHISLFHLALFPFPGMPFMAASCCLWGGSASPSLPRAVMDAGHSPVCSSLLQHRRARASRETVPSRVDAAPQAAVLTSARVPSLECSCPATSEGV